MVILGVVIILLALGKFPDMTLILAARRNSAWEDAEQCSVYVAAVLCRGEARAGMFA